MGVTVQLVQQDLREQLVLQDLREQLVLQDLREQLVLQEQMVMVMVMILSGDLVIFMVLDL
jgi:hypothetical protein